MAAACQGDDRPGASLVVTVTSPGRGATAMMDDVGEPLEQAVNAVPGLAHLRTVATAERVTLTLSLRRDTDVERARAALRDAVAAAGPRLPVDVELPSVSVPLPPRRPQLLVAPLDDAWALSTSGTRVQLDRCGEHDELVVILDAVRLRAVGLRGGEVVTALERSNVMLPVGRIDPDVGGGPRRSVDDVDVLRTLEVAPDVRLQDVAELRREPAAGCRARVDGEPVAVVTTIATRGAARPAPPLRLLEGPQVHGAFAPADGEALELPSLRTVPGVRWIAARADLTTGVLELDIGVTSAGATAAVTTAITAQLERQGLIGGRWTGDGAAARPTIVTGPAAEQPCDPRVAWPCDRVRVNAVELDRRHLDDVGVDRADATMALRLQVGGVVASELVSGDDRLPVRVRFADDTELTSVLVESRHNGDLRLDMLVSVSNRDEPRALLRIDRQPAIERWP